MTIQAELKAELKCIAEWWLKNSFDERHGGIIGEVTNNHVRAERAPKGLILHARVLWFFSSAARFLCCEKCHRAADSVFEYLMTHFVDELHGGVFWKLDYQGHCLSARKQVYAQAFALYSLSAYYALTKNGAALDVAGQIFNHLESKARDPKYGGYFEAFSADWGPIEDVRLSEKDMNAPKSMNTQLHVLEAYTAFYDVAPSAAHKKALEHSLISFTEQVIDAENCHLRLYFQSDWKNLSEHVSLGHDIESSWLIWKTIEILGCPSLTSDYRSLIIRMAQKSVEEGLGANGELFERKNLDGQPAEKGRVWWVQAEAMVGFLNAFMLSGDAHFFESFLSVWQFIKLYQKDRQHGEWHWLSALDAPLLGECKAGFWKGPYHNGRAMMECCRMLDTLK